MPISRQVRTTMRTVSAPFSWPLIRFNNRFFAHRPLPSMMTAIWAGSFSGSNPVFTVSELKDFFLFFLVDVVDLLDVLIGQLLVPEGEDVENLKMDIESMIGGRDVSINLQHENVFIATNQIDFSQRYL